MQWIAHLSAGITCELVIDIHPAAPLQQIRPFRLGHAKHSRGNVSIIFVQLVNRVSQIFHL